MTTNISFVVKIVFQYCHNRLPIDNNDPPQGQLLFDQKPYVHDCKRKLFLSDDFQTEKVNLLSNF